MKGFWNEFKAFLKRGNVVDLAVAVVVGGAFGKIVTSLVNDIIMPLISLAIGGASVSDWKWVIQEATYDADGILITAETALHYGTFIQTIIDFLIIAFFIFLAIKILTASSKGLGDLKDKATKKLKKNKKGAVEAEQQQEVQEVVEEKVEVKAETQEELLKEIRDLLKANMQTSNQVAEVEENENK